MLFYEILFELIEGAVPAVAVIIPLFLQVIGQFFLIALVNGRAAEANAQDIDFLVVFHFHDALQYLAHFPGASVRSVFGFDKEEAIFER
jgi:hypothetical protein